MITHFIFNMFLVLTAIIIAHFLVHAAGNNSNKPKGNFLFVDVETAWGKPEEEVRQGCNINDVVQVCWILINPLGEELARGNYLTPISLLPVERFSQTIKKDSVRNILTKLDQAAGNAAYLVAHNVDFDRSRILELFAHLPIPNSFENLIPVCTMKRSTLYCKLPASTGYGYKWPKLPELYQCLFGEEIEEKHEAEYDAEICLKCFKKMYNDEIISMRRIHS